MTGGNLIHEQVEQYLAAHPQFRPRIQRIGDGEYLIEDREVKVGFCRQGFLVVHDGPLRQPFTDYIEKKDATAIYHKEGLKNSTLNSVPKETRISFGDEGNRYSRLDAMKVAKEQAIFREKAATYSSEGQVVPLDLREKYQKTIDTKLGKRRWSAKPEKAEPAGPAWWPGAPAPATAATAPAPKQQQPQSQQQQPQPSPPPKSQNPQLPMPAMPPVGPSQQASIFGQVPDLFQIAAARCQQPPAATGTGTVSRQQSKFGAATPAPPAAGTLLMKPPVVSNGLKAPMGLHMPRKSLTGTLRGPLCGA